MPPKQKKDFNWEKGSHLSPDLYDPLGNVREVGFNKLADGILADPSKRKEARGKKLSRPAKLTSEGFFAEEAESGLHEDFTPSDASHLIRKETKGFKGATRFKKPPPGSKSPPQKS